MTGDASVQEGGCRCGQVRFRVNAPPLMTAACHCTGCQRMTGRAFSLTAMHPRDAFAVTRGEPVIGGLHGPTRHLFCGHCKSWLFTRPEGFDDIVNVRSTMLDKGGSLPPFIETCVAERLSWASTPAVHSFERYPPMEQFADLLAEFARWGRPGGTATNPR